MCKMREEFEEWECNADTGPLTDPMWLMRDACSPENYGIVQVQHNWEVWQASRTAIRLPRPHLEFEGDLAPEMFASEVYTAVGLKP